MADKPRPRKSQARKRPKEHLGEGWPEKPEEEGAKRRVAPPVEPSPKDAEEYDANLTKEIVIPLMIRMREKLEGFRGAGDQFSLLSELAESGELQQWAIEKAFEIAEDMAREIVEGIAERHAMRFADRSGRALGISVDDLGGDAVRPVLRNAAEEGADLIRSVPERQMGHLRRSLGELAEITPFDQEKIETVLGRTGRATGNTTRLISRDQASKLIGRLNEARQTEIGIEEYKWSTSIDRRVRPTHRANEGRIFRWDDPPPTGHPGSEINCRCVALAVVNLEPDETGRLAPNIRKADK